MYEKSKNINVGKGNFLSVFTDKKRSKKFLLCILLALPTWYTVSVLAINGPSFAQDALKIQGVVKGSYCVMWHYIGAAMGSFIFGYISLKLLSRRKAILLATTSIAVFTSFYFLMQGVSNTLFYGCLFLLGIPMGGLWAVFMTTASELFGTNLRATVTTSAPNFVRGATILITMLLSFFTYLSGLYVAGILTGIVFIGVALIAAYFIEETYNRDLDFLEK
jgi:MFS family permease